MGLDQYLHAKKYTSPAEWRPEAERKAYADIMKAVEVSEFMDDFLPSASVEVTVAYWRKQNAIHKWFVLNCQDGEDDCRQSYVGRQRLEELRDTCREVLADKSKADELLPTEDGFFFGGTEYEEWYFNGLAYTAERIEKLLTMPDDWDFYYQSSW